MNPGVERGQSTSETKRKPDFVETIEGTNRRVGILEDGRFAVGIEQPPPKGQERGKIAWHLHPDIWGAERQNSRIIQAYLGIPIPRSNEDTNSDDPNLISLPEVRELLMIPGENLETSRLAQKIMNIATQASISSLNYDEAEELLKSVSNRLQRAKNPHKVSARNNLLTALKSGEEVELSRAMESAQDLLKRTDQGLRIVNALLERGRIMLDWAESTETNLLRIEFTLRQALEDLITGRINQEKLANWDRDFFTEQSSVFNSLDLIRGNPYKKVAEGSEIKTLREKGAQIMENRKFEDLERLFGRAYIPLHNIRVDRDNRIKSGEFNLYKTKKEVRQDQEKVGFKDEIISTLN